MPSDVRRLIEFAGQHTWKWFALHAMTLVTRAYVVTRMLPGLEGGVIAGVLERQPALFRRRLMRWIAAGAASVATSAAGQFCERRAALALRTDVTVELLRRLTVGRVYFKVAQRLRNPDIAHAMTDGVEKCAAGLAHIFGHFLRPCFELGLVCAALSSRADGPPAARPLAVALAASTSTMLLLRAISPPFGDFARDRADAEAGHRSAHADLLRAAEEIAFCDSAAAERKILERR